MTSEEIKQSTSMSDVIAGTYHISIRNNMCKCPFHDDRSPSMRVYEDSCYCFTCAKSWDIFSFVQDMDGVDFKTAFISLGGTYEHHTSKVGKYIAESARERRKAQTERAKAEEKRQFQEISKAFLICECGVKVYEPFSEEWCYYINQREVMRYIFDAVIINGTEEYGLDVHRKCQSIIARRFDKAGAV